MIDYESKAPGVHLEEITPVGPIVGAGTSTAALIGVVAKPPDAAGLGKPVPVTNWTAYVDKFGDYKATLNLPHAVRGYFTNGGTLAHVVPIKDASGLAGALDALTRVPDVSLVCVPGLVDAEAQKTVTAHCAEMGNRFAILDGARDQKPLDAQGALQKQRDALRNDDGAYAGLYWPWIIIDDPTAPVGASQLATVPPSGHIAGIMARSDGHVGVHKAPANETVRGARDLDYPLNDSEHGVLNKGRINAIRRFPGRAPVVWGARTLSLDAAWQYVNVRRLVSYVEDSLLQGLRWAVFEPNNTALWKALERSVTEFLTRVWQSGALFGRAAAEAFYVKIDEELNPPAVRAQGQVFIEIGLAPVRPAEHVILRLGLWDGGAQISEG